MSYISNFRQIRENTYLVEQLLHSVEKLEIHSHCENPANLLSYSF